MQAYRQLYNVSSSSHYYRLHTVSLQRRKLGGWLAMALVVSTSTVFSSGTKQGRKLAKRRHITCALETTEYVGKHLQWWWCRVLEGPSFEVDIQVKLGSILPTFFRGKPVRCDALAVYFLPLWMMMLIFYSTQE